MAINEPIMLRHNRHCLQFRSLATNLFIYAKTAPPQMISYQINIIPKWLIKNAPNYFVDNKN